MYYPVGKTLPHAAESSTEVVLLIHGLGGCSKHWEDSEIAPLLASRNCTVVCIDLYTHGKSEQLDNKRTKHTMELFLNQIYDVIHHPKLPLHSAKKIVMQGFSFGGFLTLAYIAKHHAGTPCCQQCHTIHKAIFHSPWDGKVPLFLRMLIHVPGLLGLLRPADMQYIRSNRVLKEILLNISKHDDFTGHLNELLAIIRQNDQQKEQQTSSSTCHNAEEMLFIAGSVEIFFSKNAKQLHKITAKRNHKIAKQNKMKPEDDPHYRLRLCPCADHMTFVHCTEGAVGEYFRREIENFVCPSDLSNINVEVLEPIVALSPVAEEKTGDSVRK